MSKQMLRIFLITFLVLSGVIVLKLSQAKPTQPQVIDKLLVRDFQVVDKNNKPRVAITTFANEIPMFTMFDKDGKARASIMIADDDTVAFKLLDRNEEASMDVMVTRNQSSIVLKGADGKMRIISNLSEPSK
jgi:hypothetical protein